MAKRSAKKKDRYSIISCVTSSEVIAPMVVTGSIDILAFKAYINEFLSPYLGENTIIIMDNYSVHRNVEVIKLIENTNAKVVFLPPYSPELNPVELVWSKLKQYLKSKNAQSEKGLFRSIRAGLNKITSSDCRNWFSHCGIMRQ